MNTVHQDNSMEPKTGEWWMCKSTETLRLCPMIKTDEGWGSIMNAEGQPLNDFVQTRPILIPMYKMGETAGLIEQAEDLKRELELMKHRVLCCGVAASHPDPTLTETGAYRDKWDTEQAERVRTLRRRKDALWQQLISVRGFVASDKLATSYQGMGQYRTELLKLLADQGETK